MLNSLLTIKTAIALAVLAGIIVTTSVITYVVVKNQECPIVKTTCPSGEVTIQQGRYAPQHFKYYNTNDGKRY